MALAPIVEAFQWGKGGAKMTPEEIAREREIAQALMQVDTSPVGHWTQGLARVANAAAGAFKDYRAGQAEKGNASFNSDIVASLLGGSGGAASIAPSLSSEMSGNAGTAAGGSALASLPTGERADYIRSGIINRGLPEHVADAFIMNFQDESGLDPGINEANPIVPGSRGGFGLYQLTGPRRRAYEAFAAERGVPLDDIDAQLDFMMLEGQGPEKAAFEAILSAPDTGTAAAAIVNKFLRPAEEHRVSRANRYMSYGGAATPAAVDAVNAMAAGQQNIPAEVGDAMGRNFQARPGMVIDQSDIASLSAPVDPVAVAENEADVVAMETAMAAQDPSAFAVNPVAEALTTGAIPAPDANPNAAVASSLTRHAVNPDLPMAGGTSGFAPIAQALTAQAPQQAQGGGMQQAIIQALTDPRSSDQTRTIASALLQQQMQQQDPMRQLEMDYKREQLNQLRNPQPQQTAEMQNLAWRAQQAGLQPGTPEYNKFMMTGGRNDGITVNNMGNIPAGYQLTTGPDGAQRMEPIPGSPAAQEVAEAERMRGEREGQGQRYGRIVLEDIGRVLEAVESKPNLVAGPLGSMLSNLPGTGAHDVASMLNTIRANVGFDRLQAMRATSPTGGALGAVSDSENRMLQSTLGALEQSQSPQQFAQNLRRLQNLYTEIVHGPAPEGISDDEWSKQAWGVQQQGSSVNKPISEMTDEELEALANGN